jgi:prepilin-type N-terminal cleavage/methylation domain-containing protein
VNRSLSQCRPRFARRAIAGFTLLEVMIATAISAVGIVSLLELFSGSTRLVGASAEQTEAVIVARSIMDAALWQSDLDASDEANGHSGKYRWRIEIFDYDAQLGVTAESEMGLEKESEDYELKEILVSVAWQTPGGRERSIELNSVRLMEQF